jgi:hypothetical protein
MRTGRMDISLTPIAAKEINIVPLASRKLRDLPDLLIHDRHKADVEITCEHATYSRNLKADGWWSGH